MPFIFNLNNCQPRKPTNICIPTLVHYLVKYERFLGVSYIQIHQSTSTRSGWSATACPECGFFFSCLGKRNFANRQTDKGEDGEWTGRLCYALFYVCIALKNIWFPSKCRIWNYGQQEKKCFHAQGIFLHEWKFLLYVLCCQWCCVWMLNMLKISQM